MKRLLFAAILMISCYTGISQQVFDSAGYQHFNNGLYETSRFDTSLRVKDLSMEEKLEGLSKVWYEAKFNFANFDLVPSLNWDSIYRSFIPKVLATGEIREYYRVLRQFNQHLRDGHSRVMEPPAYFFDYNAVVPFRFAWIDNQVVLTEVLENTAPYNTAKPGWVLEKIDGIPVTEYIQKNISPVLHFSTVQDSIARIYTYELTKGKIGSSAQLEFKTENNNSVTESYPRKRWTMNNNPVSFNILEGNIGYLQIDNFASERTVQMFDSLFPHISKTKALIIDLRMNGGGNSNNGHEIIGCLMDKPFLTNISILRNYRPSNRAWNDSPIQLTMERSDWKPYKNKTYTRPVAVLIGPSTYSAAEDFTGAFKGTGRGKLYGEATGGSTGQPLGYNLPGGGIGFVCTKRDVMPNGEEFVGKGIQPDITVRRSISGIRQGRDEVLQAAIKDLR